ncbi:YdeI family protein [Parapedobacter deserti]|uniref:YdeI family protein n=1 Tax=Parapedobacter deserti TaxID=1912957 RepID=A0ABV7JIL2_9SPHI
MKIAFNPQVDKYLIDGCMRCKYGGTPQCKVNNWRAELELLRQIVLETGLKEEIKWGAPVYTHHGKNIVSVGALKESANIGFFKGVLLTDKHKILQQQGNLQSDRIVKFTNVTAIEKLKDVLKSYVLEAIAIEESGKKVEFKKNPEPIPDELTEAFEADPAFKKAFYSLTPGRQRGYIIHFSQPKQAKTRIGRIEKYKAQIFDGIGLNDKYSC